MADRTDKTPRISRPAEAISRAALRRPATAGRDRPRAGDQAVTGARRRAHRQSRRSHRRRSAGADARSGGANRLRLSDGDAQRAPGGDARPPHPSQRRADRMTRILWILAVLLSHWRRHPMQLATLLIGLISATALWSGVPALNQQARSSYDRAAAAFGGVRTAVLAGRN